MSSTGHQFLSSSFLGSCFDAASACSSLEFAVGRRDISTYEVGEHNTTPSNAPVALRQSLQ